MKMRCQTMVGRTLSNADARSVTPRLISLSLLAVPPVGMDATADTRSRRVNGSLIIEQ